MVVKRKNNYIFEISKKETVDFISFPSCFANYCKTHISCNNCAVKMKCKSIPLPKEPQWCNPD